MPAKWPIFINNVSSKLDSRSSGPVPQPDPSGSGIIGGDFAKFLANEYVSAVSTAQTPFGNTHSNAGQKPVLEQGFIKAFTKLFTDYDTSLEDRKILEKYESANETLPKANLTFDPHCEIEKWTLENTDTLEEFNYYSLYESTCPVPYPEEDPNETDEDIDFSAVQGASNDINNQTHNLTVRFILRKFNTSQSFKIKYLINDIEQPLLTIDPSTVTEKSVGSGSGSGSGKKESFGFTSINVPTQPGTYTYSFKEIFDGSGKKSIKVVNKTKSITIGDGGVLEKLSDIDEVLQGDAAEYPESITKPPRNSTPVLTEEEQIDRLVTRILDLNDGTRSFKYWLERLETDGYYRTLGGKVYQKIEILDEAWRAEEKERRDISIEQGLGGFALTDNLIIPPIEVTNTINKYIFQEENSDRPKEIHTHVTEAFITKFTYVPHLHEYSANYDNSGVRFSRDRNIAALYKEEKKRWWGTQEKWGRDLGEKEKQEQEEDGEDPYRIMASAVIKYWQSATVQPFTKGPPVPPCAIPAPLGGIYAPIYYGSKTMLANDLRRAWNTGKIFEVQPANPIASKLVASAVAVAFAKHLLLLKFLYLGGIPTPGGPVPMVGFVPVVF